MSDLGNKEIFAKNLLYYMHINKKSRVDVCRDLEIPYSTFTDWCNANIYPRIDKIELLANYFDIRKSDLVEDKEKNIQNLVPLSDLQQTEIPVLGKVKAGYDYLANENVIGHVFLDFKPTDPENYYALQVTGDSMEPLFSEGDIAIVHKQDDFESGNTCIVLVNGDEATVKKVIKKDDGIDLIAMNPYYPVRHFTKDEMNTTPVKIIGKVVEARKRKFFE